MKKTILFVFALNLLVIIVFGIYVVKATNDYNNELLANKIERDRIENIKNNNIIKTEEKKEKEVWTVKHEPTDLEIKESDITVKFVGNNINMENKVVFGNGRLYFPLEIIEKLGGSYERDGEKYTIYINKEIYSLYYIGNQKDEIENLIYINEIPYIVANNLFDKSGVIPVIDSNNNIIDLYYKGVINTDINMVSKAADNAEKAYLRIEDIMPDGVNPEGDYTDEGLEKLRILGEYLKIRGQEFYVAWIPIYVNPYLNIINDLSATTSLYNANFIYTLDYLAQRGGHIGIHGLTHQYGGYVSADGYEFDGNSPWTIAEKEERIVKATKIARYLRIKYEFFEFPHYEAMYDDFISAEKYFDILYENNQYYYPDARNIYSIEREGRNITYVPTPADYVYNEYGLSEILEKLKICKETGMDVSLFFHPRLDFKYISGGLVEGNKRNYHYSDYAILPSIVDSVIEMGNTFSEIEKQ